MTMWLKSVLNVSLPLNLDSINTLWTIRKWSSLLSPHESLLSYFIEDKKIISPVYILKSSAYLKAHKIIGGILVVFSLLLSLLIISNCFHFLVELFFDRPFTYKTLAWLKYNYIVTFFTPLIAFLFSYIEGLLNNSIFNSDVYFNYFKFFETYRGFWIFAFVFYCLHKAFKKGYHYTEDQALTI